VGVELPHRERQSSMRAARLRFGLRPTTLHATRFALRRPRRPGGTPGSPRSHPTRARHRGDLRPWRATMKEVDDP
jgi:hypothetical protein